MDRVAATALRALALAAIVVAAVWVLRGVSREQVERAVQGVRLGPLALAMSGLLAASFALRTARFQTLLGESESGARVPFPRAVSAVLLSQAANNVLPLRAGEVVKTREFVGPGRPARRVIAAQAGEKVLEVVTLAFLCLPAFAVVFGLRRWSVVGMAAIGLAAPPLAWIAVRRGVAFMRLASALGWSVAADAVEVAIAAVTLRSMGLPSGLLASAAVVGFVNLAIAVPTTPGHVGALEAGAALSLLKLGVARSDAVAFALLYRLVQWIPVTLGGAAVLAWRALSERPRVKRKT